MSETLAELLEKLKAVESQLDSFRSEFPEVPIQRLTVLRCPVCGHYKVRYTTSGPLPTYCSKRCYNTAEKRRQRARKKLQEKLR